MLDILLPAGLICTFFFFLWCVMYPEILWSYMTFKYNEPLYSIGAWVYCLAATATVVTVVRLALSGGGA